MITLDPAQSTQPNQEGLPLAPQHEIHLAEYWNVIVKRRRLIIAVVVLALAIGAAITMTTPPTYKAITTVDIEPDRSTPMDVSNGPQLFVSYDEYFQLTQARLIKSRQLGERVVTRLDLFNNPEFNSAPERKWWQRKAPARPNAPREVLLPRLASKLQSNLEVLSHPNTNVASVTYTSTSPKLAAEILNAVVDAYIDWNLEAKYLVIGQASQFLNAQIEQLKEEIESKEQQLQKYGRSKDIVSTDPRENVTLQNLQSLNSDYARAMADRVAREAHYRELLNARADTIADNASSGAVTTLRSDLAKLEREYADKLNVYKPEWPAMQQLKAQVEKMRQNLDALVGQSAAQAREQARNEYMTALRREESLKGVLQGQKNAAMTLNTDAVEYNNLKTEVETKRRLLDVLLKRSAEAQVASRLRGERLSNIRVIDRALPGGRFKPSPKSNALLSLLIGVAGGIGLAFFLEYLDRSLRSGEQVERILRLPSLGVIPSTLAAKKSYGYGYGYGYYSRIRKSAKNPVTGEDEPMAIELLPHEHPRSAIAEAYRAFRTSLLLSRAGGIKTIGVTSTMPAEGKTTTVINLSVVLGQLGRRVLVVDADLHKPRLHELFRVSNRVGLVSILAENTSPTDAIVKTSIPGVFVVPSGPSSPNPSGLLSSEAMKKFLDFVSQNFDHVVIDTPPVSPVADALLIGSLIDGMVLAVRGGRTPREQVIRVRDKLLRAGVQVLGVLINNLADEIPGGYGRYYAYYNDDKDGEGKSRRPRRAVAS